ncbi:MAG TPA: hypothetical protein VJM11_11850 [Nevskiaceae bacterium]|nr:hypothetical protein [Nevskiaceae bacterium]
MPDCPFTIGFDAPDAALADDVLLRLTCGPGTRATDDPRDVRVPLDAIGAPVAEVWRSRHPVEHGTCDGFGYAHDGQVLLGSLHVPAADLHEMERTTRRAYVRIEILLRKLGYPHWLRMWNYIEDIRLGAGDDERYRQFALGRFHALQHKPGFEDDLPAATAIGSRDGGMLIFFLASRTPGRQIENRRQVSAFRYPRDYGPRAPSFSRALLKPWDDRFQLYVSGTASIVGHESRHPGDPVAQLEEVHRNIQALLEHASERAPGRRFRAEAHKLYLQVPEAAEAVTARARALFGADAPMLVLEGQICRADLLLEVEGVYVADA